MKQNNAIFHFELQDGSTLKLNYRLQQNSLSDRWVEQVLRRQKEDGTSFDLKISNKDSTNLVELMEKLNSIVDYLNSIYDKELPKLTDTKEIDHNILNFLHEEFEEYGARHAKYQDERTYSQEPKGDYTGVVWYKRPFNLEFHESWLALNQWIHITETAMETPIGKSHFSCLVQYYPFERGDKITELDKLFLTGDFQWGHLYLGYNTLGKDYMHTAEHNDVRVITNDQVKVQEEFSTEVFLEFNSDIENHREKKFGQVNFYQWYLKQPKEVQDLIPMDDLNKLVYGRYYLGILLFDDTFLNFHNNYNDWDKNINNIRHKWNQEVFSKIVKVKKIEIV